jgi:hypothetical protein
VCVEVENMVDAGTVEGLGASGVGPWANSAGQAKAHAARTATINGEDVGKEVIGTRPKSA